MAARPQDFGGQFKEGGLPICAVKRFPLSLRHPAVSLLKDAGVPDSVVLALFGHESAAMSHRYTHVGKEALSKAAKTLPEI